MKQNEKEKSESFCCSYTGQRDDVVGVIPLSVRRVLDVGCSTGELGANIKNRTNARVIGIERDVEMAAEAEGKIDRVIVGDVEEMDFSENEVDGSDFDCVVFADVLEHLRDPWEVLMRAVGLLESRGLVIISLPNVRHHQTISGLLFRGYWPYRDRGIHDRTHLRFFTLRNIKELLDEADLELLKVVRKYRIVEDVKKVRLNRFSRLFALPFLKEFFTFQYVVVAKKKT